MSYLADEQNRLLKFSLADGANVFHFRTLPLAGCDAEVLQRDRRYRTGSNTWFLARKVVAPDTQVCTV